MLSVLIGVVFMFALALLVRAARAFFIVFKFLFDIVAMPLRQTLWLLFAGVCLGLVIEGIGLQNIIDFFKQESAPAARVSDDAFLKAAEVLLRENCGDGYTYEVVKEHVEQMAEEMGFRPENFYAVALVECGLNPFRVRDDGVAAGVIQFTRSGLEGLTMGDRAISLEMVKHACRVKDADFIMRLTHVYLKRKMQRAGWPTIAGDLDLYLAVFAPAHMGASRETKVYCGKSNPAYYLNSGLDGWRMGDGIIYRGKKDGCITVGEIELFINYKRNTIVNLKR